MLDLRQRLLPSRELGRFRARQRFEKHRSFRILIRVRLLAVQYTCNKS